MGLPKHLVYIVYIDLKKGTIWIVQCCFIFFSVLQLEKDRDKCGCIFRGLQQPQVEGVYPGS